MNSNVKDEIAKAICPKCDRKELVFNLATNYLECLSCGYSAKLKDIDKNVKKLNKKFKHNKNLIKSRR